MGVVSLPLDDLLDQAAVDIGKASVEERRSHKDCYNPIWAQAPAKAMSTVA